MSLKRLFLKLIGDAREQSMMDDLRIRRTYQDSCELLAEYGFIETGTIPPIPNHQPQYDDEEPLGVTFFRTSVGEADLDGLTLPRTYFAKSQVGPVSFKNTDLSESTLCWNDFDEVNFTDAELSRSDLRASNFTATAFVRANLRDADLRHASFEECDFTEADMLGAKLTYEQAENIRLSAKQREAIDWQNSDGDDPPGG
jgi:BTB/POZ domain-containing protein KCTD9